MHATATITPRRAGCPHPAAPVHAAFLLFAFGDLLFPVAGKVVAAAFGVRWLLVGSYGGIAAEIAAKNMPPACFLYAATEGLT